jgi:4-aminobutyrate--pyruvate transaminase
MSDHALAETDVASVLHPMTNAIAHAQNGPDLVMRGEGPYIFDERGNKAIDAMSGLWAVGLGYSEERLIKAAERQYRRLPYYHTFAHKSNQPAIELAAKLKSMLPQPMSKIFFCNSGSEAIDTAIRMVWYYWNALNQPSRKKIIARQRAYHGSNVASGSATGLPVMRNGFDPLPQVVHTACPHHWRYAEPGESESAFSRRLAADLEKLIQKEGPDTIGAFIAEPVMGAGGVIVPPEGYFPAIQEVLSRHQILMISDEVICGFGRTGKMFGTELFAIKPDIMTFAKQLSSAYFPIGAVAIAEGVFDVISRESERKGVFGHGYTYSGHPVGAAVALETLNIYTERDVVGQVAKSGLYFQSRLRELREHPLVGEVRGVGLIAAVELVADKKTKKLFEPTGKVNAFVAKRALENGLVTRALPASDALGFCPPLFCSKDEFDEIIDKFKMTLDQSVAHAAQFRS